MFEDVESRHAVLQRRIEVDNLSIPVSKVDQSIRFVYVHHCSVEVGNSVFCELFSTFGTVLHVEHSYHVGTSILNGSRTLKMILEDDIPLKLHVLSYPRRVWYYGQPQICHICEDPGHCAAECPLKGLCKRRGHSVRDCTNPPSPNSSARPARPAPPSTTPAAPSVPAGTSLPAIDTPTMDTAPDDIGYSQKRPADDSETCSGESISSATSLSTAPRRLANAAFQMFRKKRVTVCPSSASADVASSDASAEQSSATDVPSSFDVSPS